MNKYELTVVLPEKTTPAKKKSVKEKITKLINNLKGKVLETDDWGEKELAYPIKKSVTGVFLHFNLELDKESVRDIPAKLKLEEDIIRYLLVKRE